MERTSYFAAAFTAMIGAVNEAPEGLPDRSKPTDDWTEAEIKYSAEWAPRVAAIQERLATHVAAAALLAYKSGEMDLLSVLNITATSANLCGSEFRTMLVGETALMTLVAGKPKLLNRRKSPYPTWVKRLAVDIIIILRKANPGMKLTSTSAKAAKGKRSALELTAVYLDALQLGPAPKLLWQEGMPMDAGRPRERISTRTLHRWYRERMLQLGRGSQRGRPKNPRK